MVIFAHAFPKRWKSFASLMDLERSREPLRDVRHCMMRMDQMAMPPEEKSILAAQAMEALVTDRSTPLPKTLLPLYRATVLNGVDTVMRHSATREDAHEQIVQVAQACIETVVNEPDQDVRRAYVILAQEVAHKEMWCNSEYAFIASGKGLTQNTMPAPNSFVVGEKIVHILRPDQENFHMLNMN